MLDVSPSLCRSIGSSGGAGGPTRSDRRSTGAGLPNPSVVGLRLHHSAGFPRGSFAGWNRSGSLVSRYLCGCTGYGDALMGGCLVRQRPLGFGALRPSLGFGWSAPGVTGFGQRGWCGIEPLSVAFEESKPARMTDLSIKCFELFAIIWRVRIEIDR